jgi:hypothetical protein
MAVKVDSYNSYSENNIVFCFDLWVGSDRMTHTVILMSTIALK